MARIVLCAATLRSGGGIAQVARLTARILREAGHEIRTVTYLDQSVSEGQTGAGGSRIRFLLEAQLAALRADLCIYDSAGMARAHPHWTGRPCVVWLHGAEAWEALRSGGLRALQRADRVIAVSQHSLRRFEALHGSLPAARVCSLATEEDTAPDPMPTSKSPLVLIVGRIDAAESYKGHDRMVEAWPSVVAAVPKARLVVVGSGSGLAALQAQVAASPARSSIELRGFVEAGALNALWAQASLFAMPSRGEGFGLVYVEAMRHGLPVITSTEDAGCEVNVDGVTGFCVDLLQPDDLPGAIIRILRDPALRTTLGQAARQRWHEHYRYADLRSRLLPLIEGLLPAKQESLSERGRHGSDQDRNEAKKDPQHT